jgi:hypothetical protein
MPRFVILRHETPPGEARPTHWDLMLESGAVLRTWALPEPPSPGCELTAEELPDHRLAYLDYEGQISGDRGHVKRWDAGTYEMVSEAPQLRINVRGDKLIGEMTLRRAGIADHQGTDVPRSPYWTITWKGS